MDLSQIKEQIQNLVNQNKDLKNQIKDLENRLSEKEKELKSVQSNFYKAKVDYDNLLAAKALAPNSEKAKASQMRLLGLVRKIDRCIELLNKQE